MGPPEQDTSQIWSVSWHCLQSFPGRSGLGQNSVGGMYSDLGRERATLQMLILSVPGGTLGTICGLDPSCTCFRHANCARAICVASPLLLQKLQVVKLMHAGLRPYVSPTGSYAQHQSIVASCNPDDFPTRTSLFCPISYLLGAVLRYLGLNGQLTRAFLPQYRNQFPTYN